MADRRLRVFYTVAKQPGFTKAADILAFIVFVENKFQQCNVDVVPMKCLATRRSL